jgi:hypothetical protein
MPGSVPFLSHLPAGDNPALFAQKSLEIMQFPRIDNSSVYIVHVIRKSLISPCFQTIEQEHPVYEAAELQKRPVLFIIPEDGSVQQIFCAGDGPAVIMQRWISSY